MACQLPKISSLNVRCSNGAFDVCHPGHCHPMMGHSGRGQREHVEKKCLLAEGECLRGKRHDVRQINAMHFQFGLIVA